MHLARLAPAARCLAVLLLTLPAVGPILPRDAEAATAAASWSIASDFSDVQGHRNFYYGYTQSTGPFALMPEYGVRDTSWTVDWNLPLPQYWTLITRDLMLPNGTITSEGHTPVVQQAVLRWVSPITGSGTCFGHVQKNDVGIASNGVVWLVRQNGVNLYARFLAGQDAVGFDYSVEVNVVPGDAIDFVLDASQGNDRADLTGYTANLDFPTVDVPPALPGLTLGPARPNPARTSVTLPFTLPRTMPASLAVHDLAGRRVRVLESGTQGAGVHAPRWDLTDEAGRAVGAGLYFVRLEAEGRTLVRRIVATR